MAAFLQSRANLPATKRDQIPIPAKSVVAPVSNADRADGRAAYPVSLADAMSGTASA